MYPLTVGISHLPLWKENKNPLDCDFQHADDVATDSHPLFVSYSTCRQQDLTNTIHLPASFSFHSFFSRTNQFLKNVFTRGKKWKIQELLGQVQAVLCSWMGRMCRYWLVGTKRVYSLVGDVYMSKQVRRQESSEMEGWVICWLRNSSALALLCRRDSSVSYDFVFDTILWLI
jgi:hypothetical protein